MPTKAYSTNTTILPASFIPGVTGFRVLILGWTCLPQDSTAAAVSLTEETSGTVLDYCNSPSGVAWHFRDSEMYTATSGKGVGLTNAGAAVVSGHVMYTYVATG